jgi:DNA primase
VRLTDRADYPVVFPIYMGKGNLVGYVYRRIDKVQRRKYLYPKHLRIGSIVAYYEVERGPLVLVEGIMDFMKVAQFGCSRAAAIFSWRITAAQAAWLKEQGVKSVICALDNTPTGEEGCERLKRFFPHVVRFRFQGKHRKDIGELNVNEYAWGLP